MKLRTRIDTSSPVKGRTRHEESSDWSLTSPVSVKSTGSSSPRRRGLLANRLPIVSPTSTRSTRSSRTNRSMDLTSDLSDSQMDTETEEDPEFAASIVSPVKVRSGKRPLIVEDFSEASSEMVDIMTDEDSSVAAIVCENKIVDPSLQGLLEDAEVDLEEDTQIDESDRKLYEMAFNRAEMSSSAHQNQPMALSDGIFKGNRGKNTIKTHHQQQQQQSTGRGKGKDLFSVLKQRVRGPKMPSIRKIYFGTDVAINPWYSAPYPSEYHSETGELWICEFCLQYMKKPCTAQRHLLKCHGRLPPGDEIYRDPVAGISVFEINGREAKLYCQNLCLLAKMFLDHKTLYYDVDPFLFYVLIEWKVLGTGRYLNSFVGYFSKEKINPAGFNVSCILTMPHHQRKGYGSFLIDFSYLLSRREGRLGSPEKPLSDLGLFSYVSYWKTRLLAYFSSILPADLTTIPPIVPNLDKICLATGMTENDILSTMEYLRMLRFDIIVPDPSQPTRQALQASILIDKVAIEAYRAKIASRPQLNAKEEYLRWQPYKCIK